MPSRWQLPFGACTAIRALSARLAEAGRAFATLYLRERQLDRLAKILREAAH
jgi:hypothetical protein